MDMYRLLNSSVEEYSKALSQENINTINEYQRSLLQEAIAHRRADIAKLLIDRGIDVDYADKNGDTALQYAIAHDENEIALQLIHNGCDINKRDKHGNNALWQAVLNPRIKEEVIQALLNKGADVDTKNNYGRSTLDMVQKFNVPKLNNLFSKYL